MAEKPNLLTKNKFKNRLKMLATTSALVATIASSSTAFGVAANSKITTGNAAISDAVGAGNWHDVTNVGVDNGNNAAGPVDNDAIIFGGGHAIDLDVANRILTAVNVNNKGGGTFTVNQNTTIGSIVNTGGAQVADFTFNAARTLTFTGTNAIAANHGFNAAINDFTALGEIDANGNVSVITFNLVNAGAAVPVRYQNLKIADGANASLSFRTAGNAASTHVIEDESVADARAITIGNGQTLRFFSNKGAANATLELQRAVGDRIVFEDAGSILELASKGNNNNLARHFKVIDGSLGGVNNAGAAADGWGVIHFNTTGAINVASNFGKNVGGATAVVGVNRGQRAGEFTVTAAGNAANVANIKNQIFAKTLSIKGDGAAGANSAPITFEQIVDVGDNGVTKFYANATKAVTISENSNLGNVDFANIAGVFEVVAGKTLSGNFIGDAGAANSAGTIRFLAAGTLQARTGAVAGENTTENLTAVEAAGGVVNLTGTFINTPLQITNAAGGFTLADGFVQDGGINTKVGANAGAGLTLLGNATITGDIGTAIAIGDINLANDSTKALTLKTTTLTMNAANSLIFGANGGTVAITDPTVGGVLVPALNYTMNIALGADNKGTIDATDLKEGQTLHITGKIIGGANSLSALSVANGANLHFTPGAANFLGAQTLTLGEKSELTFDAGSYKFVNVPEAAAKVTVNGNGAAVTFQEGTIVLGTKDKPIDALEFTAAGASTLELGKNVSIYTTANTIAHGNAGDDFVFNGGGKNVVSAQLGTAANKFNTLKVDGANTKVELQKGGIFNGVTILGDNTILYLGDNYTTKNIVPANANLSKVETINTAPMILTVTQVANGGAAVNPLKSLVISGSDVTIDERLNAPLNAGDTHGLTFSRIDFTNKDVASTVTLAPDSVNNGMLLVAGNSQLELIDIHSIAGNSVAHTVVVNSGTVGGVYTHKLTNKFYGTDANNTINIRLDNNDGVEVTTDHFFAGVSTVKADTGTAQFKNANAAYSRVFGIGDATNRFGEVEFFTTTENFGNTYSKDVTIYDGVTGTFKGNFHGTTLNVGALAGGGAAVGGSKVVYRDGINLDTSALISHGANNTVTFEGSSVMNNSSIGSSAVNGNFTTIKHTGDATKTAQFSGAYYSDNIDFGNVAIKVTPTTLANGNIINGTHKINNKLDLGTTQIIFDNNNNRAPASQWGENTSLAVTITDAGIGNIINKTSIDVADKVGVLLDEKGDVTLNATYTLMDNTVGVLSQKKGNFYIANPEASVNRYAKYRIEEANKNIVITRVERNKEALTEDVNTFPGVTSTDTKNTQLLLEAKSYIKELSKLTTTKAGESIIKLTRDDESATNVTQSTFVEVSQLVSNRLVDATLVQGGNLPDQGAPSAGDDDTLAANRYGAWAMPFYSQSVKKDQGATAGYKAKAVGGVFGFDTKANDNMTIGAAVSLIKTDVKHKGWKAGDKTTINSFTFSVYGVQQLAMDFFAQGVVTYGSNKVKGKALRIGAVNQTAHSNYDSMSFGGELMFGYNAKPIDNVLFTPMAGIRYNKVNDEGYKETGTTNQNKTITKKNSHRVEGVIGARVVSSIDTNGLVLNPEAHGFISHKLGGKNPKISSKLDGMTDTFTAQADKTPKTYFNLGASISTKVNYMEYGVAYDATIAKKYLGHMGSIKVRVNF